MYHDGSTYLTLRGHRTDSSIMGVWRSAAGCLGWSLALVAIVVVLLKFVFFDTARFGHNGMAPTIVKGERVLISKNSSPHLGTIAVCEHPLGLGPVVGRVAALGGSTIDTVGGTARVDNIPIESRPRGATNFFNADLAETQTLIWGEEDMHGADHFFFTHRKDSLRFRRTLVPTGHLYLLGDNRTARGQDSRTFGPVNAATCKGTVFVRVTRSSELTGELAHGYLDLIQ